VDSEGIYKQLRNCLSATTSLDYFWFSASLHDIKD